jgi:nitrate reductase cytochrome c-type subunit
VNPKPESFQVVPKTPDFSQEAKNALKYEGLPPLVPIRSISDLVIFTNVSTVFVKHDNGIREAFSASEASVSGNVVVEKGEIVCMGDVSACSVTNYDSNIQQVDLKGGSISCVFSTLKTFLFKTILFFLALLSLVTEVA